jgi:hypothetical protein
MKTEVAIFELPSLLGIPQHVEYEPPPREWCTSEGCPHEGVLTAEGCRRGVCIRYRAWVFSWDGERWSAKERWRRRRVGEESGGCLRQQVADALWEVAERGHSVEVDGECGVVVNGVYIGRVSCRSVGECVEEVLRGYERARETSPKPRRDPAEEEYEELLQKYPLLRWWSKSLVIDALRRGGPHRWGLRNLLSQLSQVDEKVWALLGRFDLDLRCTVEVYTDGEATCVRFYVGYCELRLYCFKPGEGWRAASGTPRFIRLKPTEDGRIVEVYEIENREFVRVV